MRVLLAGASGVLGRATLPHLRRHEVVGLTRTEAKLELLRKLGAEAVVCDVYEREALVAVAHGARPEIVVNFLTDLSMGSAEANNRIRREGAANLLAAAEAARAARLVVASVAFALEGDGQLAVDELERAACAFAGESLILRFGRLWGPGTFHRGAPRPPTIHVDRAGVEAARIIVGATTGSYIVTDEGTGSEQAGGADAPTGSGRRRDQP